MTPKLKATLIKALGQLETERAHLDRQVAGLQAVLEIFEGGKSSTVRTRSRKTRTMSAAARRRIGARMKKYWAERRKAAARSKKMNTVDQKRS